MACAENTSMDGRFDRDRQKRAGEHKMCRSLANVIQGKHSDKRFGMAVKDD